MKNDITEEDAKKLDDRIKKEYPDKKAVPLAKILKSIVKKKTILKKR